MFKFLKRPLGFSLISLVIVVFIIATLAYGSSFFWRKGKSNNDETVQESVQRQLSDLEKQVNESNRLKQELLGEQIEDSIRKMEKNDDLSTEDWRIYEKLEKNVRLKYHKDWYYDRDEQAEKELEYNLYVGFGESPEVLTKGRPYPIDFIIVVKDHKFPLYYSGYIKTLITKDNKKFILKTGDQIKYKEILDKMAESFEFLNETIDNR